MSVAADMKGDWSIDALRILALFRARGCQLAGRGLLWQVIAPPAVERRFGCSPNSPPAALQVRSSYEGDVRLVSG